MGKFQLDLAKQVILVDAQLRGPDGAHIVRLILDTGATFTMISPEILLRIGCDPSTVASKKPITTASGIEYVPFVRVPEISALGMKCSSLEICAHSLPQNLPARGLLGLNFLRNFNLRLNFPGKSLEIDVH